MSRLQRTSASYDPAKAKKAALRRRVMEIHVGDISATDTIILGNLPVRGKILDVKIVGETDVAAHDTNYWQFQIQNLHGADEAATNLLSSVQDTKATGGTEIDANAPYSVTPDQYQHVDEDETLALVATKVASATTIAGAVIQVEWEESGVTTTTSTTTTTTTTTTVSTSSTTTTSTSVSTTTTTSSSTTTTTTVSTSSSTTTTTT